MLNLCKIYLNLVCLYSNQLGNFDVQLDSPYGNLIEWIYYCTVGQPIRKHNFEYRPYNELSHMSKCHKMLRVPPSFYFLGLPTRPTLLCWTIDSNHLNIKYDNATLIKTNILDVF